MFEKILVYHCAPTLKGLKASNLFFYKGENPYREIKKLNFKLKKYKLKIIIFKEINNEFLIYIFREDLISNILKNKQTQIFLNTFGYKNFENLNYILNIFKKRIQYKNFPHEIGVLLDYPLEDVQMFISNKGKNYKISGIWKVYGNEEISIQKFKTFEKTKEKLILNFENGINIENLCSF